MQVLSDHGLMLMRTGDYKRSYKIYIKIYQASAAQRAQALETWLGKHGEVARYGLESLNKSGMIFSKGQQWDLPQC